MAKLSLFIADVDDAFVVNVINAMRHSSRIQVIGYARDGVTAMRQVAALHPNVLLTDIQLPAMDGIELIHRACIMKRPALCVACTRFYSDAALDAAQLSGAAYCLYKPIDYSYLPQVILRCWDAGQRQKAATKQAEHTIAGVQVCVNRLRERLTELGFPVRMYGSLYIVESMLRLRENPTLLKNLTKGLYTELAAQLQSTPSAVERSLRCAITCAYERGSLSTVFPEKPSNRVFLEYIRRILLDLEEQTPPHNA